LGATFANSNKSEEAIRSYNRALEINPTYIRARCNLAIACIQLSLYKDAAEQLITALSIQSEISSKIPNNHPTAGVQSTTVWTTLKMVVDGYCNCVYHSKISKSSGFKRSMRKERYSVIEKIILIIVLKNLESFSNFLLQIMNWRQQILPLMIAFMNTDQMLLFYESHFQELALRTRKYQYGVTLQLNAVAYAIQRQIGV